jgi:hypothetical protein
VSHSELSIGAAQQNGDGCIVFAADRAGSLNPWIKAALLGEHQDRVDLIRE